jgi:uncharacterized repeat protein (TIGR01451 family)
VSDIIDRSNLKRPGSKHSSTTSKENSAKKNSILKILFALYITFIILSQIPLMAENFDYSDMVDNYEAHLTFKADGKTGHYYVERYDTGEPGIILVEYVTQSNSLEVDCTNIKVLRIHCREMYETKSQDVFNRDPGLDSNYYKTYFMNRDYFNVHVYTSSEITELSFIDTPIPYNVSVNGREWWLSGVNYTYKNDGIVLTKVPLGHNYVDIYFQSIDKNSPTASFTASKTIVGIGESIDFDASDSKDPDGEIISFVWDFGDGSYKGGEITQYSYPKEGKYNVILTVTDDDYFVDRAMTEITVIKRVMNIHSSVDKPIATPGSILNYTFSLTLNETWTTGIKDIIITDILPYELKYLSATPLPHLQDNTLTWKLGIVFENSELPVINLQTVISEEVDNNTLISNFALLDYNGLNDQKFPQEHSNLVITRVNVGSILAPKIRLPIEDIELPEDSPPYNLHLNAYEYDFHDSDIELDWHITNKNESLYIISGEYSDDDTITITPLPDMHGNSLVILWLVDSEGYSTSQPLWINITPVNDEPIFSSAPDLILHYDEEYTFDYEPYVYDVDTPNQNLQLFVQENLAKGDLDGGLSPESGETDDLHHSIDRFKVTYKFPKSYVNQQVFISLVVFDGSGNDGDTIQINITDDYTPRVTKDLPDVWLMEGETKTNVFDIDEYFEDPDQDSLFYSFGETHIVVIINDDHTVDITSPSDWNGVDTVTFRARDPMGAIAEDTILVTVTPLNDAPVIEGVPEYFTVHYDSDYSFDLTPYISDEDNQTEDLFLILTDEHVRTDPLNELKIIMNYPKSMFGLEIPVKLIVSDGIDTGSQDIVIKITDSWPPEIVTELSDISFNEDESLVDAFNLNNYFSDKDSNALFYTYGQKFVNIFINMDGSVDFSAEPNWYGVEAVTFRATDPSNAFVESVIRVTVNPVNDPPFINPLPIQYGFAKNLFRFDLSSYIIDIDNEISELDIKVFSSTIEVSVKGRELLFYSDEPVVENITITVSDGLDEVSKFMLVEIRDVEKKNAPSDNYQIIFIWLIVIVLMIIISIAGFTAWRKYTGNYKIEEVFCIYNNGILISHVTTRALKPEHHANEVVVSGMLTAVLNFTQDAFTEETKNKKAWGIKEIQMNEKNILVERGKYTYLATVFSGRSGKRLYMKSRRALNNLENRNDKLFQSWDGNLSQLSGTNEILRSMIAN